jgi:superoxide reductase
MKIYVCQVCSHIAFDQAPVDCPVCGMAIENFEKDPEAIKKPADSDNLSEEEKRHIPVVHCSKGCGLISDRECIDVHIKIGEILHVMESEHFVNFIDLYIDKKYVTRVMLTPQVTHPAVRLNLKINDGVLRVIVNCNIHGYWMARMNLNDI